MMPSKEDCQKLIETLEKSVVGFTVKEVSLEYRTTCSMGDMKLLICMLHNYINVLESEPDEFNRMVNNFYIQRFQRIAERFETDLGYDYEKRKAKCEKKALKGESNSDIGADGITLAMTRGRQQLGKKGTVTDEKS